MRTPLARLGVAVVLVLGGAAASALAQQATPEDRLREALRRSTVDLRAAQDAQATLQAQLDSVTKQRDQIQQALDEANAKLAAAPPPEAKPEVDVQAMTDEIATLKQENAGLQASLAKWQGAYREAAGAAQERDAEAKRLDASLKVSEQTLAIAKDENTKLVATAEDILHLYRTQDFHSILLWSYEPVVGLKQVELQNMVQDYEDKIYNLKFIGNEKPAPAKAPAKPPAPKAPAKP
jgi:chromosome segregation ATPase